MMTLNTLDPALFAALLGLFGLLLGSFLNVVIVRLPKMMARQEERWLLETQGKPLSEALQSRFNLLTPRSHCPRCQAAVKPWMNIPLLSYVLLRGQCYQCKHPFGMMYFWVEFVAAALGAAAALAFGVGFKAIAVAGLAWTLLTLTVIDWQTQLLPDVLTLPLLWAGLLFNLFGGFVPLSHAVLGAVFGYLSLWVVFWLFKLTTGKEGMGYGDFKLLAALGAWLGWTMLPMVLLLSSMVGLVVSLGLKATDKMPANGAIAFGPYLAMAGLIAAFFGANLLKLYGL